MLGAQKVGEEALKIFRAQRFKRQWLGQRRRSRRWRVASQTHEFVCVEIESNRELRDLADGRAVGSCFPAADSLLFDVELAGQRGLVNADRGAGSGETKR